MALERNAAVELFWRIHPLIYRISRGRIGGKLLGLPVLLLMTRGRRTGQLRTNALTYLPRGDDFVVIASCHGEPRHPAWWLNLEARPAAEVEVRGQRYAVRARQAEGEEREALWRAVVEVTPAYDEYVQRTERRIPVVVLARSDAEAAA